MLPLLASIAALFVGPLLVWSAGPRAWLLSILDGFVVVTLGGLVLFHLFPEAVNVAGGLAAVAAAIGVFAPGLLSKLGPQRGRVKTAVLAVALLGLALHAALDGAGLAIDHAPGHHHDDHDHGVGLLAIAIVLHRIPVGLGIWWIVTRRRGSGGVRMAAAILGVEIVATLIGFWASQPLIAMMSDSGVAIAQAVLAGMLLHVVFAHRPDVEGMESRAMGRYATIGALLGAGALLLAARSHPMARAVGELAATSTFVTLALESAPVLLASFAATGLWLGLTRPASKRTLRTGSPVQGVLFGLRRELCSCDVLPLYGTLARSGVPATAGMAFLIATPQLGLDALLISFPLLGPHLASARVGGAIVVALAVAWALGRRVAASSSVPPPADSLDHGHDTVSLEVRLRRGMAFAFGEMFDHVGPWIAAGLFVAALAEPLLPGGVIATLPWPLQIALVSLLAIPPYVSVSGAAPLIAILVHKGMGPGAAMAFLLIGPAINRVTLRVLRSLHGTRVALGYTGALVAAAVMVATATRYLLPDAPIPWHDLAQAPPSPIHGACLVVLGAVLLGSLLRQGPRGFVAQLTLSIAEHDHGPEHDHAHHHAH